MASLGMGSSHSPHSARAHIHPAFALTIGVRQRLGLAVPMPLFERLDLIEPPQPLSSLAIKLKARRRQLRLLALRQLPRLVLAALLGGPTSKLCVVTVAAAHMRITMPANTGQDKCAGHVVNSHVSISAACEQAGRAVAKRVERWAAHAPGTAQAQQRRHPNSHSAHSTLLQLLPYRLQRQATALYQGCPVGAC